MTEDVETKETQQEAPSTEAKKQKKGLSLSSTTVELLKAKAEEASRNQSEVADQVLAFSLPYYDPDTGLERLAFISIEELLQLKASQEPVNAAADPIPADFLPTPESAPTRRGHPEKLRVPGMNQLPGQPQQVAAPVGSVVPGDPHGVGLYGAGLYRPNMGQEGGPLPPQEQPQAQQGLSQVELDYIVARLTAAQAMSQPPPPAQPYQPGLIQQPPVDVPYNQPPAPAPPMQFAASYPPGYTGAPGVGTPPPPPQPYEGMYPYPGPEGQRQQPEQRQPAHMNDPYAMNMGNQAGNQQPLTAQGLLSGAQAITPNVAQRNINMEIPRQALGANWRQNMHGMTAANRRG